MRLIDADETLRLMEFEEEKYQYEEHYGYREAEKFIASQPTIEAIPVEWLKDYEAAHGQEARLQEAIEDWRKENATV